jgi:hypothetical protein
MQKTMTKEQDEQRNSEKEMSDEIDLAVTHPSKKAPPSPEMPHKKEKEPLPQDASKITRRIMYVLAGLIIVVLAILIAFLVSSLDHAGEPYANVETVVAKESYAQLVQLSMGQDDRIKKLEKIEAEEIEKLKDSLVKEIDTRIMELKATQDSNFKDLKDFQSKQIEALKDTLGRLPGSKKLHLN